jgi:hypothetical protein
MSVREKARTLYSRNGIRIVKTENLQNNSLNKKWCFEKAMRVERLENLPEENKRDGSGYVVKRYESPLGFYYTTTEWVGYDTSKKPKSVTYKKYIIWLDTTKYELEYPTEYSSNNMTQHIDVDMRPWDILPGYNGMPDNMVNALVREINGFIDLLYEYKKSLDGLNLTPESYRKSIMIDLFGYEDGPKIQPNDIKILSHGFDLKESFRKRKES